MSILVYGAGKSGIASANLLLSIGEDIILFDTNPELVIKDPKMMNDKKFTLVKGELNRKTLDKAKLVIISPGIPRDIDDIKEIESRGIPIIGEIELAYQHCRGKIIAITGTNGKTTTTSLVGEILKAYFNKVFVVGNIGNPFADIVFSTDEDTRIVAELSSFQLESIIDFKADVAAVLNITPDHLNRHHTMEEYTRVKMNITKNQNEDDYCILNYDDIILRDFAKEVASEVVFFSLNTELEQGLFYKNDEIIYSNKGKQEIICNVNELKLIGKHNYENIMAAVAIAIVLKVPMEDIKISIKEFKAVEHRIEFVDQINGVRYYNDSKGTNPDASKKAVEAMKSPTILIAGGYDKDADFTEFIQSFGDRIKQLILIGQTREQIAREAMNQGFTNIIKAESLKEAVQIASRNALNDEAVLLSPACASWGMFKDYEERGRLFKEYVRELLD